MGRVQALFNSFITDSASVMYIIWVSVQQTVGRLQVTQVIRACTLMECGMFIGLGTRTLCPVAVSPQVHRFQAAILLYSSCGLPCVAGPAQAGCSRDKHQAIVNTHTDS